MDEDQDCRGDAFEWELFGQYIKALNNTKFVEPAEMRRMEAGRGCECCGLPSKGKRHGYRCCGDGHCKRHLDAVFESHQLADRIRGSRRNHARPDPL